MAQYVIHKIGFFYTDECFEIDQEKGTVMGITKTLEEAQAIKSREDLISMKGATCMNAIDLVFGRDNFDTIHKNLMEYFQKTYNRTFDKNKEYNFELPQNISDEEAAAFLSIMELNFHNIVEYGDDEVINPADYEFDEEDEIVSF